MNEPTAPQTPEAATPRNGFTYIVTYGGGIGPDVWDKDQVISAVDIEDATKQAKGIAEECGGWVFAVIQDDYPSTRDQLEQKIQSLREELSQQRNTLFVPDEKAKKLWPKSPPACEVVQGGVRVTWEIAAKAIEAERNTAVEALYSESDRLRAALTAITRNQSEKPNEDGLCPFGCDAPWIAMSALGEWDVPNVEAWKP